MNGETLLDLREQSIPLPGASNRNIHVSLQLKRGDICILSGANGAGKTTFLKWLFSNLKSLSLSEASTQFLSQGADEDYILPCHLLDAAKSICSRESLEWENPLFPFELWEIAWNKASLGERQRALLSGVMQGQPQLLLLDEPTSALDSQAEKVFWTQLHKLCQTGTSAIVVYHGGGDNLPPHKELHL